MSEKKIDRKKIKFDDRNANKGSDLGKKLLHTSISKYGAGRSILLDKNNKIIAGNHTAKEWFENGTGEVMVVETTGDVLVAVKRMDIDKDSAVGHEMAIADNRVAQANIVFDAETLKDLTDEFDLELGDLGIDLSDGGPFFDQNEPDAAEAMETSGGGGHGNDNLHSSNYDQNIFPLAVTLTKAQKLDWERFKKDKGFRTDTDLLLAIFKFSKENF
jgi:hypothetical protein